MKLVKNCSTCGHMEIKGFFIKTEFCKMARKYCRLAREYPNLSNCGDKREAWIPGDTITVSFEDYEKMKTWEQLNK